MIGTRLANQWKIPMLHLLLTLALACTGSTSSPDQRAPGEAGAIDVAGLRQAMDAGAPVVIDVRTDDEFNSGHVPGARHISLNELPDSLDSLNDLQDQPLYLICASGGRSGRAALFLAQEGFAQPINVEGGTNAWREAGYSLD